MQAHGHKHLGGCRCEDNTAEKKNQLALENQKSHFNPSGLLTVHTMLQSTVQMNPLFHSCCLFEVPFLETAQYYTQFSSEISCEAS